MVNQLFIPLSDPNITSPRWYVCEACRGLFRSLAPVCIHCGETVDTARAGARRGTARVCNTGSLCHGWQSEGERNVP